jgi:hypothetical protein
LTSSLPTLLTAIAAISDEPLNLTDFVVRKINAGYPANAKGGILILTYAGMKMLLARGVLRRDRKSQGYVFAGSATA